MSLLEAMLCLAAGVLLVPVAVLGAQVAAALPAYRAREMPGGARPALAVVVPACNEALGIADTLRSIAPQLAPGDRLLVVADNCSDDTAAIAAAAGAEVIERHDVERRGKGYALDFGVRHLEREPPQAVIVIDADCRIGAATLDWLARLCIATGRPVQARYRMDCPDGADWSTRIAQFAWIVKTLVRPLGYRRLGLPCQLMGTGMAFPWALIARAPLASGNIVEDLALGLQFARAGRPASFCPEALVTSPFPATCEGIAVQRTRWEHGHLNTILGDAPQLLAQAVASRNGPLLALALDLCVPPLALLAALLLAVLLLAVLAASATTLSILAFSLFGCAVLVAWWRHGREALPLRSLACVPFYVLWKIPLYLNFLLRRQAAWVRSRRG